MKAFVFAFLAIIGFSNCAKKVNNFMINDYQSIQGIKIGMPIDDALKILNKKHIVEKKKVTAFDDEPTSYEYEVANKKNERLFTFNAGYERNNKNKVFRIVLTNPTYVTPEGIKVGMNVKELKTKTKLKSANFNFQDGLYLLSSKFDGGYWIALDPKKQYNFKEKPLIKDIPDDLRIKGIVIF
ncbi:MAG: hypothetical protein IPN86_05960 [Saprospiraceae bacterium]|nr:hypothetical protein [Saprospiraceae bacterium]